MDKGSKQLESMAMVHPNAAGLDIGSHEIFGCVPPDRAAENVKVFGTFTADLSSLADWLAAHQVDTVAMESTGVYWIPAFELLEARGFKVYLVNARSLKGVPGRKSDFQDCQWIQKLHSLGLLSPSFRPDAEMCALRAYLRHRADLLQHRAAHILHMQKAFQQMNIQLSQVLTDITGTTGMAIVRAIMAGERDGRCKSSEETLAKALTGTWQEEHLFALKQSLELYDFYTQQVAHCDAQIQQRYAAMKPRWEETEPSSTPVPSTLPRKKKHKSDPTSDVRADILRLTGVDIVAVMGIGASLAQTILSEIGTDTSKWPTDKHFTSWCGLAPHNDISGAECCVLERSPLVIVQAKPFAKRLHRPAIVRRPWEPSIGVSVPKVALCLPKLPLPTRLLELCITCSSTTCPITTWVKQNLSVNIETAILRLYARRLPNWVSRLWSLIPFRRHHESPLSEIQFLTG